MLVPCVWVAMAFLKVVFERVRRLLTRQLGIGLISA